MNTFLTGLLTEGGNNTNSVKTSLSAVVKNNPQMQKSSLESIPAENPENPVIKGFDSVLSEFKGVLTQAVIVKPGVDNPLYKGLENKPEEFETLLTSPLTGADKDKTGKMFSQTAELSPEVIPGEKEQDLPQSGQLVPPSKSSSADLAVFSQASEVAVASPNRSPKPVVSESMINRDVLDAKVADNAQIITNNGAEKDVMSESLNVPAASAEVIKPDVAKLKNDENNVSQNVGHSLDKTISTAVNKPVDAAVLSQADAKVNMPLAHSSAKDIVVKDIVVKDTAVNAGKTADSPHIEREALAKNMERVTQAKSQTKPEKIGAAIQNDQADLTDKSPRLSTENKPVVNQNKTSVDAKVLSPATDASVENKVFTTMAKDKVSLTSLPDTRNVVIENKSMTTAEVKTVFTGNAVSAAAEVSTKSGPVVQQDSPPETVENFVRLKETPAQTPAQTLVPAPLDKSEGEQNVIMKSTGLSMAGLNATSTKPELINTPANNTAALASGHNSEALNQAALKPAAVTPPSVMIDKPLAPLIANQLVLNTLKSTPVAVNKEGIDKPQINTRSRLLMENKLVNSDGSSDQPALKMVMSDTLLDKTTMASSQGIAMSNANSAAAAVANPASVAGTQNTLIPAATSSDAAIRTETQIDTLDKNWHKAINQQIVWQLDKGVTSAQIHLKPLHLGVVNIDIQMQQDNASIVFNAAKASARDMLEQALPRLQSLFAEQGIQLSEVKVEDPSTPSSSQQSSQPSAQEQERRQAFADQLNEQLADQSGDEDKDAQMQAEENDDQDADKLDDDQLLDSYA
ncbi:MAG: flagellar hook-length control protein FliK [Pseudomonadales bacterium]|nr:flagellar hook-length control protein FliK [Pseudomonadales bacterium]